MKVTQQQLDAQPKFNNSTEDDPYTCACCGKVLNTAKAVWLEQSHVTNKFYLKDVVDATIGAIGATNKLYKNNELTSSEVVLGATQIRVFY